MPPEQQVIEEEQTEVTTEIPYSGRAGATPEVEEAVVETTDYKTYSTADLNNWVEAAKQIPENEGVSDYELKLYWYQNKDPRTPEELPPRDVWVDQAAAVNPGVHRGLLGIEWDRRYGGRRRPYNYAAPAPAPTEDPGFWGTVGEGFSAAKRSLGSAAATVIGSPEYVEKAREESLKAAQNPELRDFNVYIHERWQDVQEKDPDMSLFDEFTSALGVGVVAIKEKGLYPAGLFMASQVGNMAASLAPAAAGAALGSAAGPVGTVVGGISGLLLGNTGIEMGYESIRLAEDGLTEDEISQARKYGLTKGAVLTAVDTASFGLSKWLAGTARRAVQSSTSKVLRDAGIDPNDLNAVRLADSDPILVAKTRQAAELSVDMSNRLLSRLPRLGASAAAQIIGEGAGEYIGEAAASGNPDMMDAVLESFAGLGHTGIEMVIAGKASPKALQADPFIAAGVGQPSVSIDETIQRLSLEPDNLSRFMDDVAAAAVTGEQVDVAIPAGFISAEDTGGVRTFAGDRFENRQSLIDLYEQLERSGVVSGLEAGVQAFDAGDFEGAAPLIQRAADAGHSTAQLYLGVMHSFPDRLYGVDQDLDKSVDLLRKATGSGNAESYVRLTESLLRKANRDSNQDVTFSDRILPENMPADRKEYLQTLTEAAKKGNAEALYRLGVVYEAGHGVDINEKLAAGFYRRAEKAGLAKAGTRAAVLEESKGTRAEWMAAAAKAKDARQGAEKRALQIKAVEAELRYRKMSEATLNDELKKQQAELDALSGQGRPEAIGRTVALGEEIQKTQGRLAAIKASTAKASQRLKVLQRGKKAEASAMKDIQKAMATIRKGEGATSKRNIDLAHQRLAARAMQRATPAQSRKLQRLLGAIGISQSRMEEAQARLEAADLSPYYLSLASDSDKAVVRRAREAASAATQSHRETLTELRASFDEVMAALPEGAAQATVDLDRIRESAGGVERVTKQFEALKVEKAERQQAERVKPAVPPRVTPDIGGTAKATDDAVAAAISSLTDSLNRVLNSVGQAAGGAAAGAMATEATEAAEAAEATEAGVAGAVPPRGPATEGDSVADADSVEVPMRDLTVLDRIRLFFVDRYLPMRQLVENIKKAGGYISDELDPALAEDAYLSRIQKETQKTKSKVLEIVRALEKQGVTREQVSDILLAEHIIQDSVNAALYEKNPDGGTEQGGMSDAVAAEILKNTALLQKARPAVTLVRNLIKDNQQLMVRYGLESQETVDAWNKTHTLYVPLMREGFDDVLGAGRGGGFRIKARVGTATGRSVQDIVGQVLERRQSIITNGEKNIVRLALAGMLKLHPQKNFATLHRPKTRKYFDSEGLEMTEPVEVAGMPRDAGNVLYYRQDGEDRAIVFDRNSQQAMTVARAFKNKDVGELNWFFKAISPITRFIAAVNTQYSPVFGVVNLARDIPFGLLTLSDTPLAGKQLSVLRSLGKYMGGIYTDARAVRRGEKATSPSAQLVERYTEAGGPSGYSHLFMSVEDHAKEVDKLLKTRSATMKKISAIPLGIRDWVSDYNLMMENAVRLAAFEVAVRPVADGGLGLSDARGANIAKNLTVNFNRKGQVGRQLGSLFACFNASAQGTDRMARTMLEFAPGREGEFRGTRLSKNGMKIVSGGMLLGSLQPMLLAMGGIDDEEIPEWIKSRNFIVPAPGTDKGYVSYPLPLGFNTIFNAGRLATEAFMYGKVSDKVWNFVGDSFEIFSPVGGASSLAQFVTPTAVDPIIALESNLDWAGRQIYREDIPGAPPPPGPTRTIGAATPCGQLLADVSNWIAGGDEYHAGRISPTPDHFDYLVGVATGGPGRDVNRVARLYKDLRAGRPPPGYTVPLVGMIYGTGSEDAAIRDQFYKKTKEIAIRSRAVEKMRDDKEFIRMREYLDEHPEARLGKAATTARNRISKMSKLVRELEARDAPPTNRIRSLEAQKRRIQEAFINRVERTRDRRE